MNKDQIVETIKEEILIKRLEIDDIPKNEITNDLILFDESGLGLDSIEALDLIAGLNDIFGIDTSNLNQEDMIGHLKNLNTIAELVISMEGKQE